MKNPVIMEGRQTVGLENRKKKCEWKEKFDCGA